ncbi:hypothetical protein B0H13DRAFT_1865409 [Mycena leptocephala]|nr:hypothetical protein B0H13DRAFT_1865409 [Mycena leptocephala]
MAPPPRRPSAFEVSFPEEAAAAKLEALRISRPTSQAHSPASTPLKRKANSDESNDALQRDGTKRTQRLPVAYYKPPRGLITVETAAYTAPGEDADPDVNTQKPIRILSNFCIFEPAAKNELVSLEALEISDNNRQFGAAGIVLLGDEDDEDYGQEDGADAIEETERDYLRLNDVALCPFDYFTEEPLFIETQFAYYELRGPSARYKPYLLEFSAPRRVARAVLTSAMAHPQENLEKFRDRAKEFTEEDLGEAVRLLKSKVDLRVNLRVLEENGAEPGPLIRDVLNLSPDTERRPHQSTEARGIYRKSRPGMAESGEPECHTCHLIIAQLAKGYFEETLQVVGHPPRPPDRVEIEKHEANARQFFKECIARTRTQEKKTTFSSDRRQQHWQYGRYVEQATIGDEVYKKAHVQWLEHGSQIILEEMAHPQELFLTMLCEDQRVGWIAGKVSVVTRWNRHANWISILSDAYMTNAMHPSPPGPRRDEPDSQQCATGQLPTLLADGDVQYRCGMEYLEEQSTDRGKINTGVGYQGHKYHPHDFFLYNAGSGPAQIGYIENIQIHRRGRGMPKVQFTKVGRMRDLNGVPLGEDPRNTYPERHLFLTNEAGDILVNELVRPIHVYAWDFFLDPTELKRWVDYSPYHFYCSYRLPSLTAEPRAESWAQRVAVPKTLNICEFCPSDMYRRTFGNPNSMQNRPMRIIIVLICSGEPQAFAEGSRGLLKPTHLIEITPSAARTAQKNSPNLVTYCQDANVVLRYFIKSHKKHDVEVPFSISMTRHPCLLPWNLGKRRQFSLDCHVSRILAQHVSEGFLKYNLLARQAGRHRVEGGIEMGGLKLLLRALFDMGRGTTGHLKIESVSFSSPPATVNPYPTCRNLRGHDFEVTNQLRMRLPYNHKPQVAPIRTTRGRAPHASVSIEDAIGDLPPFDWKHPDPKSASTSLRQLQRERNHKGIPVYKCEREKAHCGYEGVVPYKHEPRTSFQRQARERPTGDLQHFTRCLLPKTVERVVTIPLQSGADFRSLPDNLAEWQFFSPASAVGRNKYRGGLYGRLENSGYFPTTVTNMHPTAKQSKVLHPDCLRMVSVRELARSQGFPDWFCFVSINDSVVTLLAAPSIGNAVPWQVSRALGRELRTALFEKWKKKKDSDVEMKAD